MELTDVILGRRSVRNSGDEPVGEGAINTPLWAAAQAHSAVKSQPWAFVVIQDKALLKKYSDRAKGVCTEMFAADASHGKLMAMVNDPSFNISYNSGTLIVIFAKPIGQHPDWDCCLAAQNLMLTAYDMGLGTCPIGLAWPLFEQPDIKHDLDLPSDYIAVMPIIVAYPRQPTPPVERRQPKICCWK
jgi:nitroreductase